MVMEFHPEHCVVGNCMQPYERVERCYWSSEVGFLRGNVTDHAYLDLCYFHREFMASNRCGAYHVGWDPIKED